VRDGGARGGERAREDDAGERARHGATACAARGGDGWTRGSARRARGARETAHRAQKEWLQ
jgi:hypothetical protein